MIVVPLNFTNPLRCVGVVEPGRLRFNPRELLGLDSIRGNENRWREFPSWWRPQVVGYNRFAPVVGVQQESYTLLEYLVRYFLSACERLKVELVVVKLLIVPGITNLQIKEQLCKFLVGVHGCGCFGLARRLCVDLRHDGDGRGSVEKESSMKHQMIGFESYLRSLSTCFENENNEHNKSGGRE